MIKTNTFRYLRCTHAMRCLYAACGAFVLLGITMNILFWYSPIAAQTQSEAIRREATLEEDTYVASGRINESFSGRNSLSVGYWDSFDRNIRRSMLKFNFPETVPSNATIVSATLTLAERTSSDEGQALDLRAQRLIGNWDSSITWNQLGNLGTSPTEEESPKGRIADVRDGITIWEFGVKVLLEEWASDPNRETAFSILLFAEGDQELESR